MPYETMRAIKGVWRDFVYRVRWSRGDDAEIEMWKDGERIFGCRGLLGYADETKGPYFKFGMYCGVDEDPDLWQRYWARHFPFKNSKDLDHLLHGLRMAGLSV